MLVKKNVNANFLVDGLPGRINLFYLSINIDAGTLNPLTHLTKKYF